MSYDDAAQTGNVLWDLGENLSNKQMLILFLTETGIQKKKKIRQITAQLTHVSR